MSSSLPKNGICLICGDVVVLDGHNVGGYALSRCVRCEFRFAYDAIGVEADYDAVYQGDEYYTEQILSLKTAQSNADFIRHPTYRPFFEQVKPAAGYKLLDIGCGVGRFCQGAASVGWSVEGIDLSERAVSIARQYHDFPVSVSTIEDLMEKNESYHVVTAFEVLEHLRDPKGFLQKAYHLLKMNGQLFCTVPNWDCRVVRTATRPDWIPPIHLGFHQLRSLRTLGHLSGFDDVCTGVIWTNPFPRSILPAMRWAWQRFNGQQNLPLGLWLHARKRPAE